MFSIASLFMNGSMAKVNRDAFSSPLANVCTAISSDCYWSMLYVLEHASQYVRGSVRYVLLYNYNIVDIKKLNNYFMKLSFN